jgi:hypothetical protein
MTEDPGPWNRGVTAALCIPIFDAAVAVNSMGGSGANFIVLIDVALAPLCIRLTYVG